MYQALYRKYRPQTFSDVCGQDHISRTLKNQIAEGRQSHAYLFTGSRGTGKTSSAKIFAKAVNCLHPVDGDPCNECEICKGIDSGSILDVTEIDAASNRGVDDIRNIRDEVEYAPSRAKFRVYIIDEVHMLTKEAFNALLKTLEEPPEHVIFILATTEVYKIPATILSRCQRYDFNRISADIIESRIKYVCEKETITIDDGAASLIARLADGGMRDALSMLDLCASGGEDITEEKVAAAVGMAGRGYLFDIVDMIENGDAGGLLSEVDRLYSSSCDMERLCAELISHYRDLLVAKTSKECKNLITCTKEELERIIAQSKAIKFENILYCVTRLTECLDSMKRGASKRIAVETAFIRLCTPSLDSSADALQKRIAALEDAVKSGGIAPQRTPVSENNNEKRTAQSAPEKAHAPVRAAAPEPDDRDNEPEEPHYSPAPANNAAPAPSAPTGNPVLFPDWAEVMQRLGSVSPLIHAVMNNSSAYTDGDLLLIDAPNSQFADLIRGDSRHKESIKNAVMAVTGKKFRLGPYKRTARSKTEKNQDPLDAFISNSDGAVEVK